MRIGSLRRFLIVSIFSSIIIIEGASMGWGYYTVTKNASSFFDVLLIESAEKIKVFIRGGIDKDRLKYIQQELDDCTPKKKCFIDPIIHKTSDINIAQSRWTKRFTERYRAESVFQIWQIEPEKLLLHSKHAPSEDFAEFVAGFQTIEYNEYKWRVYTQINPKYNIAIQTAQREDLRDDLAYMILLEHILPLILFTPLLLILIFIAIKVTVDGLRHITQAIKKRDPKNLGYLNIQNIPREITPLIEELNRLFEMINQSFDREKRFNSDAAHELKTPLAAIKSHTEVAQNEIAKLDNISCQHTPAINTIKASMQKIVRGVDRSNHLVSQLLLLSRISPNMPLENIERVFLDQITRETIADTINKAIDKNIEISQEEILNEQYDEIPSIQGNKILLSILARNLIDNAIKYSGQQSKVNVTIIANEDNIILEVCDTGPGLPDELKERIFDRFYRKPGTNVEGSGLGLSIVKLIASLHNASIEVTDNNNSKTGLCIRVIFNK